MSMLVYWSVIFLGRYTYNPALLVALASIFLPVKKIYSLCNPYLVGGFNLFKKYALQIGSFVSGIGLKIKNI